MIKNFLVVVLLLLVLATPCYGEGQIFVEVNKQTNGSFVWKLPSVQWEIEKGDFLFKPEISLFFTSPRSSTWRLNHHSVDVNVNMGIKTEKNYFTTFSIGVRSIFEGNSDNLNPGLEYYNTFRVGYKF